VQIRTGVSTILQFKILNNNNFIPLFYLFTGIAKRMLHHISKAGQRVHHGFLLGISLAKTLLNETNRFFRPVYQKSLEQTGFIPVAKNDDGGGRICYNIGWFYMDQKGVRIHVFQE